jgi:hypothetical protein
MNLAKEMRYRLVEAPDSPAMRARARRWELVGRSFPDIRDQHVVDLGGTVKSWLSAPIRPKTVTVLNLMEPGESDEDWLFPVTGDACNAVEVLEKAGVGTSFDVVFSNAVLEHVGGHANRVRFAESVHALAPRHWVQTPYRYFPLEPHWLFPGMQFLPNSARARVARHWPLAHTKSPDMDDARSSVLWTELIGLTEMKAYFPSSRIVHERAAGLTKSLIAIADGRS